MELFDVLKKSMSTEKTQEERRYNRYAFVVDIRASKYHIRRAVEKAYGVDVLGVRTSILPGKIKRAGRKVKKTSKTKKAFVQLRQGQTIEAFEGV